MNEVNWLSDDEQRMWRSFLRMQGKLSASLNRQLQSDSKMSVSDFAVLVSLTDVPDERLRVTELANALEWEKSRVSHQITRMERRGLVRRVECTTDGRSAFVLLTDCGRASIEAAAPKHVETVRRLFIDQLSTDDVAMLADVTSRVLDQLDAEEQLAGDG